MNRWIVESPERLLTFIKQKFNGSENVKDLRWAIEHNRCSVNGSVERFSSFRLKKGDEICFWFQKRPSFIFEKERILYEDASILVYNKPPFIDTESLARLFQLFCVHRLDRDTSGALVFAKSNESKKNMEMLFRERKVEKEYLALVFGKISKNEGTIEMKMAPLKRREGAVIWGPSKTGVYSKTLWKCLEQNETFSLLKCMPLTGRTHQIRVHLKEIGHPIVGDFEYGPRFKQEKIFRPLLHAHRLSFTHPAAQKKIYLEAPASEDFFSL